MSGDRRLALWIPVACLAGATYLAIGRLFGLPATNIVAWRRAAWVASAIVFAAHVVFEVYRLRSSSRASALHVATGSALGALALAIAGIIHAASAHLGFRPIWIVALVVLPIGTGIPAFLVALCAATLLQRPVSTSAPSHR